MVNAANGTCEIDYPQGRGGQSFERLFDEYRPKLARMVVLRLDARIVGKVDVDDVLQDAFVAAARRIDDFLACPNVPLFVWLRQITSQVLVDVHRRYLGTRMRDVRREVGQGAEAPPSASSPMLVAQLADSLTTPSQFAVRNEMVDRLRLALEDLPETDREVLLLRHLEELSNNEVAEILGIDKYAASKRYLRALGRLRNVMSDPEQAEQDGARSRP